LHEKEKLKEEGGGRERGWKKKMKMLVVEIMG